jgi:hypothetical protein
MDAPANVHTIEALLGLPPMNNNDALAPVMASLFRVGGTQKPFTPILEIVKTD